MKSLKKKKTNTIYHRLNHGLAEEVCSSICTAILDKIVYTKIAIIRTYLMGLIYEQNKSKTKFTFVTLSLAAVFLLFKKRNSYKRKCKAAKQFSTRYSFCY